MSRVPFHLASLSVQLVTFIKAIQVPIDKPFKTLGLMHHRVAISSRIREVHKNSSARDSREPNGARLRLLAKEPSFGVCRVTGRGFRTLPAGSGLGNAIRVAGQALDSKVFFATARTCSADTSHPNGARKPVHPSRRTSPDARRGPEARPLRAAGNCA